MNTFKKKSLCAALAGVGVLGVTGAAQAVNLSGTGTGQVLIYPYFTVRADAAGNSFNSLLSVVNSTACVKAVKVRFLEARNSQEVLDFNLFLSPHDVWTTAIIPSSTGGGAIITADHSCTLPPISGQINFVNFQYAGDGGGDGLDRTQDGYVEIIEMATYTASSTTAANVTHPNVPNGTPPGCAKETDTLATTEAQAPNGGLFGGITLINVNQGQSYQENAVAIDNYSVVPIYANSGFITPTLAQATPPLSIVTVNIAGTPTFIQSAWLPATADPVSAILMHDNVMNEIVLDSATKSTTDWVITEPTKRYYVRIGTGSATPPFQRNFSGTSCDDVTLTLYDREEFSSSTPLNFSPPPPTKVSSICYEANVLQFGTISPLASNQSQNLNPALPAGYQNGWLNLGFEPSTVAAPTHTLANAVSTLTPAGGATGAVTTATYFGLPVIGFMVQTFTNNTIMVNGVAVQSNYGGDFDHRYVTRVQSP